MNNQLRKIIVPLIASIFILILLEVLSTTFLPVVGLTSYRIPFNILLTLFMAFKLKTVYLPFLVLIIQYVHSFFSVDGWEIGTIAGILVCITISYFKDLVHFSSYITTVIVTQVFQLLWFLIICSLLYMKGASFPFFVEKMWRFLPESIVVSLIAPLFFSLLDKIWDVSERTVFKDHI